MTDVNIVLNTPIEVPSADIPFDRVKFSLAVSPIVNAGVPDYAASLNVVPYRILADGTIDDAPPSLHRPIGIGSVAQAIAEGGVYGQVCGGILQIMAQALTSMK